MMSISTTSEDRRTLGSASWPFWVMLLVSLNLGINPKNWADIVEVVMSCVESVVMFLGG